MKTSHLAVAVALAFLGTAHAEPWTELGLNTGDEGFLTITSASADAPATKHALTSTCTFKKGNGSGAAATFVVVGKTKAGPHATPVSVGIRCVVKAGVQVVFDQSRSGPAPVVEMEGTGTGDSRALTICTYGEGTWSDTHWASIGLTCREPSR